MVIIGKLIKPCKIVLYEQPEDGGEVESFTLLKLSFKEAYKLILESTEQQLMLDDSIVIPYSGNDKVHQLWKEIAVEHSKNSPQDFIDVSAEFKTKVSGTSCLIRDPLNHIIRIALRNGDDKVTINKICIDNQTREKFFNDAKLCTMFKVKGKYAIDTRDIETYSYWSKYMNTSFIMQLREVKKDKANN